MEADSSSHAFYVCAEELAEEHNDDAVFIAVLDGHIHEGEGVDFPGQGAVDAETVLEQPEVFS